MTRSPQASLPRPWEAGVSVSPWSVVNFFNGNILTELTLAEFGVAGPAVRFTLFHNGASAAGSPMASPSGYTLGPGDGCRTQPYPGSSCLLACFENSNPNQPGAPRNWTDSSGECCRYVW